MNAYELADKQAFDTDLSMWTRNETANMLRQQADRIEELQENYKSACMEIRSLESDVAKLEKEVKRLIGSEPITYGTLTFCKNCGQQDPYSPQTNAEPVAFRNKQTGEFCTGGFLSKHYDQWIPLYTAPQTNAEPVGRFYWESVVDGHVMAVPSEGTPHYNNDDFPLYTAPQTKPLSDEEIKELSELTSDPDPKQFVRAIEERHGIK